MSCVAAAVTSAVAAVVGTTVNAYQQNKANKQQKAAAREQKLQSDLAMAQQEQDFNRANRQQANIEGLLEENMDKQGTGTSLSGLGGSKVDPLKLGGGSGLLGG